MAKARFEAMARHAPRQSRPLARHGRREGAVPDWRKRISDHVAYALLVYTGLQIFVTMAALRGQNAAVLPALALVVLVAGVIPACRQIERRWTRLSDAEAADPARARAFYRDRALVWGGAIGLPFVVTGGFRLLVMLLV